MEMENGSCCSHSSIIKKSTWQTEYSEVFEMATTTNFEATYLRDVNDDNPVACQTQIKARSCIDEKGISKHN